MHITNTLNTTADKSNTLSNTDVDVVLSMLHYGMYRRCLINAVDINGELGKHMLLLMVY